MNSSIETTVKELIACINGDTATREFMEREIRKLAKDAERYHWLKDNQNGDLAMELVMEVPDADWDAAIDKSMAAVIESTKP